MKTKDFYFDLPQDLIAQEPAQRRGESRLLVYKRSTGEIIHSHIQELSAFIDPGTLMIFNNTKVRKARLYAKNEKGSPFELVLTRRIDASLWEGISNKSARLKQGTTLFLAENQKVHLEALHEGGFKTFKFDPPIDEAWLDRNGHIPLPPYIRRADSKADEDRYQTIYAGPLGSAAAPTAGLHFTPEILKSLDDGGKIRKEITLHVGLGTFLPVRSEDIEDHAMHFEDWSIPEDTAANLASAKKEGRKVLAVGTTSCRTLEAAGQTGQIKAGQGSTNIFMYPGYSFKIVDQLFTNFHTPESTLLMLVSAFAGKEEIFRVYRTAVEEKYRFFSYGDAMLIL